MAKAGNDYHGDFIFLVDDIEYAYVDEDTEDSNITPTGIGTVNMLLTAGQTVRVQNSGSFSVFGSDELRHDVFLVHWPPTVRTVMYILAFEVQFLIKF